MRELQRQVLDALSSGDDTASLIEPPYDAASLIKLPRAAALLRLHIYRSNTRANFVDALHSSYPVLWRLVGEDYFRQIAREFQRRRPSRSGDLLHVGDGFDDYVRELHAADEYRYLADIARLEWLIQNALLAAEHAPLDLTKLAAVEETAYDELCFELHPTLRLFSSPYPALRIWQANANSDAEPESIDLDSGGDRIAVMRSRLQLTVHQLSPGEQALLGALRRGTPFAAAVAAGAADDADFDAGAALRRFVAAEAIVDFR